MAGLLGSPDGVQKLLARASTLSYVPVTTPMLAIARIRAFFAYSPNRRRPGCRSCCWSAEEALAADCSVSSMMGGKMRARAVEHRAPMSEMKAPRFGTPSAIRTVRRKREEKERSRKREIK